MPVPHNQDLDASGVASPAARPGSSGAPGRNRGVVLPHDASSWSKVIERILDWVSDLRLVVNAWVVMRGSRSG
jgi:hypothetical protein